MLASHRFTRHLSRAAMALALATAAGTMAIGAAPAFAKEKAPAAPKVSYSKGFQTLALPFQKAIGEAGKRADVVAGKQNVANAKAAYDAATTSSARKAAAAQRDAAIAALGAALANERALLDGLTAAITLPDDKYGGGSLMLNYGLLAEDAGLQRKGLQAMVDSGKTPPADLPRFNYFIGQFAFDAQDYPAAATALQSAIDAGFPFVDAGLTLAEVDFASGKTAAGLDLLKKVIDAKNASGTLAPEGWYRRGLGLAYRDKMQDKSAVFANALVAAYPSKDNWAGAISVLRLVSKYELQERLDLLRLMQRTHSFSDSSDYAEFIQAADPRRLPAEVLAVIDEGLKAGKLDANDLFVSEAKTTAGARVKEDLPTLAGLEASAKAANATGVNATATADALLSYGMPDKAEALYNLALQRGGVDAQRIATRIGIAQFDQGKYADAKATFDKITGIRQPLAQLWSIYASQKAKGG